MIVLRAIFISLIIVCLFYLIRVNILQNYVLLSDLSGITSIISFIATLYTLVSAFVLIEVWNQYNGFSNLIEKEAQLLKSIWKLTDYFNDIRLDEKMKMAIKDYINEVQVKEFNNLKSNKVVITASKQTEEIGKIIDSIRFNDKRDSNVFNAIIKTYDDFISIRNDKNISGITRLPFPMKFLYSVFSVLVVIAFSLLGFNSMLIYFISFGIVVFGIMLTYLIINDLDNPLGGIFKLETDAYLKVLDYIEKAEHNNSNE